MSATALQRLRQAILLSTILTIPASAWAQYFGQSKVRYRDFDFQILHTAHFDVYFYPEEAEAAKTAALLA